MGNVRVAMIGCGGFQRYRLGNLLKVAEAEVVALVDPSEKMIQLTKDAHPRTANAATFTDHQAMLAEIKPDAVMIATPHTQHVGQILDSFAAGAHVCCEKPLVTTVDDANKVIAARDAAGKVGVVSYQRHFQAEFRYIRERIASGEYGKVQFIQAMQAQEWKRGTKGTWRQEMALSGGGQLNDSGSHLIDILLWTSGLKPEAVAAFSDNLGTEVDINSALSIRFEGGAMANVSVVGDGHGWHEDISFWTEKATFYIRNGKLTIQDEKGNKFQAEHLSGSSTADQNFIDAILGRAEVQSPFECGLQVIRLTQAAWESAAKGGSVVAAAF